MGVEGVDAAVEPWIVINTHPHREHMALENLGRQAFDAYCPMIRRQRSHARRIDTVLRPLFPNYLFARLELGAALRAFHHARGVQGIVHFGAQWPTVPEHIIENLRARIGEDCVHLVIPKLSLGDSVEIADGVFGGLEAVVTRVMPGTQRVAVLLAFLGSQTTLELPAEQVLSQGDSRKSLLNTDGFSHDVAVSVSRGF